MNDKKKPHTTPAEYNFPEFAKKQWDLSETTKRHMDAIDKEQQSAVCNIKFGEIE